MKIVINKCHGGFSLSFVAVKELVKRKKKKVWYYQKIYPKGSTSKNFDYSKWKQKYKQVTKAPKDKNDISLIFIVTKNLGPECTDSALNKALQKASDVDFFRYGVRQDPDLVAVVEKLGEKANGSFADLKVVEIPDGVNWQIEEYDGLEWISEVHQTWS